MVFQPPSGRYSKSLFTRWSGRFDVSSAVAATCEYGGVVNAAFRQANVFATQFHPEKSGPAGLALLRNFVRLVQPDVVQSGVAAAEASA